MNVLHTVAIGIFATVALAIVFVRAGQSGGLNGGQQTAMIANGMGSGGASVINAIEGQS